MLAENLKTAADLRITDAEFDALRKVLKMLERGELVDVTNGNTSQPNGFCMSTVGTKTGCGTVGCIKGWAQFLEGNQLFNGFMNRAASIPHEVNELFMYCDERRHTVSAAQAAIALRNYLTYGEPRWAETLAE